MVDVETLEHILEPRQLCQSAVAQGPVGKDTPQGGEELQFVAGHARICVYESRNHHVATVLVDCSVGGIEYHTVVADHRPGIDGSGILVLDALSIALERVDKLIERL